MADKMRWRYGDTSPVVARVAAETVVELGDILWQDAVGVRPWAGDNLCHGFMGVAMQRSRAGDESPIRVATTGVFEFDCEERSFELGWTFSPLGRQAVYPDGVSCGIGRCAKFGNGKTVLVDIRSEVMGR